MYAACLLFLHTCYGSFDVDKKLVLPMLLEPVIKPWVVKLKHDSHVYRETRVFSDTSLTLTSARVGPVKNSGFLSYT